MNFFNTNKRFYDKIIPKKRIVLIEGEPLEFTRENINNANLSDEIKKIKGGEFAINNFDHIVNRMSNEISEEFSKKLKDISFISVSCRTSNFDNYRNFLHELMGVLRTETIYIYTDYEKIITLSDTKEGTRAEGQTPNN